MSTNLQRSRTALTFVGATLRAQRRAVLLLLAWSLVEAIPAFLSGRLVQLAVDQGFLRDRLPVGLGWLALLAASFVAGAFAARQVFRQLGAVIEPMRDDLARRVVAGSIRRSARLAMPADRAGVARLTEQVEITREACASVLMVAQGFVVATIGAIVGLLSLIPAALALVLPPVAIGLAIFVAALPRIADRQLESILADERTADGSAAVAAGMRDVVASGAEDVAAHAVDQHIDAQAEAKRRLAKLTAVRTLAVATGGLLPVILILAAGGWLRGNGATTGVILGALTYVLQGVQPALQQLVRNLGSNGAWLVSAVSRIGEIADDAEESDGTSDGEPGAPSDRPAVQIEDLTFAYSPAAEPVANDLNLTIAHGDHIAIVGPSGAGKSTLASLIAGLLAPSAGAVRIGSMSAAQMRRAAATQRVLIPQEAYVFSASLLENITYLNPGASRASVERAVAALAPELAERIGGLDAPVDPAALSAGERQLITLVRAYVSDAPVIVLDEATCHLDPHTEAEVEAAFARRDGTLIVIAHRISSAQRAKRVLLLDRGDALIGTHEELVNRSRLYCTLVGRWSGAVPLTTAAHHLEEPESLVW
ncbi:MAG: ABC transporter ATP-binding protein [Candidatus Dormibacteria bacterium]